MNYVTANFIHKIFHKTVRIVYTNFSQLMIICNYSYKILHNTS